MSTLPRASTLWTGFCAFCGVESSLAALSPYGWENENHIERFHGSTSIALQEAPQLTKPPVFSSDDQSSTPHSPSTMFQHLERSQCCAGWGCYPQLSEGGSDLIKKVLMIGRLPWHMSTIEHR